MKIEESSEIDDLYTNKIPLQGKFRTHNLFTEGVPSKIHMKMHKVIHVCIFIQDIAIYIYYNLFIQFSFRWKETLKFVAKLKIR